MHYTDAHNRERNRQQVIADIRAERSGPSAPSDWYKPEWTTGDSVSVYFISLFFSIFAFGMCGMGDLFNILIISQPFVILSTLWTGDYKRKEIAKHNAKARAKYDPLNYNHRK